MEETNNHNLNMYSQGETGWTHSTDMSTIEENLPISDTEGNLSTYTPHDGALFFASDSGKIYEGDGTEWLDVDWDLSSASVDGNPLATETWVSSNFNNYTDSDAQGALYDTNIVANNLDVNGSSDFSGNHINNATLFPTYTGGSDDLIIGPFMNDFAFIDKDPNVDITVYNSDGSVNSDVTISDLFDGDLLNGSVSFAPGSSIEIIGGLGNPYLDGFGIVSEWSGTGLDTFTIEVRDNTDGTWTEIESRTNSNKSPVIRTGASQFDGVRFTFTEGDGGNGQSNISQLLMWDRKTDNYYGHALTKKGGDIYGDLSVQGNLSVGDNDVITTEDAPAGGYEEQTADGSTTTFTWPVEVSGIASVNIDAATEAASVDFTSTVESGVIGVEYATPPEEGEVLGWYWTVIDGIRTGNYSSDVATETWVSSNFNNYTFSESYNDLTDIPTEFTPENHDNSAHSIPFSEEGHDHTGEALTPDTIDVDQLGANRIQNPSGHTGEFANRKLYSESSVSVSVPGDYSTIQAALDDIPIFVNHTYDINVDPSSYAAKEDLFISTVFLGDTNGNVPASSSTAPVVIKSSGSENFDLGSAYVANVNGVQISLNNCTFHNGTPYVDRDIPVVAVGSRIRLWDCAWNIDDPPAMAAWEAGAQGTVKVQNGCDVGDGQVTAVMLPKIFSVSGANTPITGSVDHLLYTGPGTAIITFNDLTNLTINQEKFQGPGLRGMTYIEDGVNNLIDYDVDSDTTTNLNLSLDAYGTNSAKLVVVSFNSDAGGQLKCTFNGVSTDDYAYTWYNDSGMSSANQPFIEIAQDLNNRAVRAELDIHANSHAAGRINASANVAGVRVQDRKLMDGMLDISEAPLQSVEVFADTGNPTTGYAYLVETDHTMSTDM